jgi:L-asparaginase
MLILNCGGTFNKRYNPINGELEVPYDNSAIEEILQSFAPKYALAGLIYKDSLDMDANDRKMIANIIMESHDDTFLIIHGTDTMDLSAAFLAEIFTNKKIVFTGAMRPFSIDKIEASFNLGMAFGFLSELHESGVYICMNGYVKPYNQLVKNKHLGKFEHV